MMMNQVQYGRRKACGKSWYALPVQLGRLVQLAVQLGRLVQLAVQLERVVQARITKVFVLSEIGLILS